MGPTPARLQRQSSSRLARTFLPGGPLPADRTDRCSCTPAFPPIQTLTTNESPAGSIRALSMSRVLPTRAASTM
jgi:hypothetical protein